MLTINIPTIISGDIFSALQTMFEVEVPHDIEMVHIEAMIDFLLVPRIKISISTTFGIETT